MDQTEDGQSPVGQGTILLVEDDAILVMSLTEAFIEAGAANVRSYARADEAVAAMADQSPDLLVLDCKLSDSDDGWGLAEIASHLFNPTPQIIFSTGSPQRIPKHLARLGKVIAKPYDPKALAKAGMAMITKR